MIREGPESPSNYVIDDQNARASIPPLWSIPKEIALVEKRPYLDFYANQGAHLVSRDISNKQNFFEIRESLLCSLGITPGLLKGKAILEFGPGTGHNSLYIDTLSPEKYVLVEGDQKILDACKKRLIDNGSVQVNHRFVLELFEDFSTEERFDLVIAESCLPNQVDPERLFRRMLQFVKPGGLMMFTTVSPLSWLSEVVRRLVGLRSVNRGDPVSVKVEVLNNKLQEHFAYLPGMARSRSDWILDNLIQPYDGGKLFPVPAALDALSGEFRVSGVLPDFIQDWRWYKDSSISVKDRHAEIISSYFSNACNFIDRRNIFIPHSRSLGVEAEQIASAIWDEIRALENGDEALYPLICDSLRELADMFRSVSDLTADSICEAVEWIDQGMSDRPLQYFPSWWGRGQQHVCVYRLMV